MIEASLIISVMALVVSLSCLVWLIAQKLSTHVIQYVPADPFQSGIVGAKTSPMGDDFKELGEPLSQEEQEYFEKLKAKK